MATKNRANQIGCSIATLSMSGSILAYGWLAYGRSPIPGSGLALYQRQQVTRTKTAEQADQQTDAQGYQHQYAKPDLELHGRQDQAEVYRCGIGQHQQQCCTEQQQ